MLPRPFDVLGERPEVGLVFDEVVDGAGAHGFDGHALAAHAGDHDHRRTAANADLFEGLQPGHARQPVIEQYEIDTPEQLERLLAAPGEEHPISALWEPTLDEEPAIFAVVHDEDR